MPFDPWDYTPDRIIPTLMQLPEIQPFREA
jgi:hypothetical protein